MKKNVLAAATSLMFIISIIACNKGAQVVNTNVNNTSPTALLPLVPGNVWVYQDSTFDTTRVAQYVFTDTAEVINNSGSLAGNEYWFVQDFDSTSCFGGGGYFNNSFDQYGYPYISETDNSGNQDLFFATTNVDGTQLTSPFADTTISPPPCTSIGNDYGYATTFLVNGYTCYMNKTEFLNCNGVNDLNAYTYVCPGVGVVRYEVWVLNQSSNSNSLYLWYSQTLTSYKLK